MLDMLETTVREADAVIRGLTPSELLERRTIQGRDTTVFEAMYHVVEHFAMHTGQIVLLTKVYAPDAIHFYDDSGWKANPLWGGTKSRR